MKKIRVVHFTSSLKMGGAEAALYLLIQQTQTRFDHHVIYVHDGPYVDRLRALNVPVSQVTGFFFRFDPFFFIRLCVVLRRVQPDCLHTLLWAANVAGRLAGRLLRIPVVSVFHNNIDQDGGIRNFFDQRTVCYADRLVAVSEQVADSITTRYKGVRHATVDVVKNGIPFVVPDQNAIITRADLGLLPEHFVIGSVGRFVPLKNYPLLIKSFALVHQVLPQARLVLVGVGPEEMALRELVKTLSLCTVVQFVVGQWAQHYYVLFNCFVLASDKEGVSIALLEAMSHGLACVVTNTEKDHAVVQSGKNGIVVEAGNIDLLVQTLVWLHEHYASQEILGVQAAKTVQENFTVQAMAGKYGAIFTSLAVKSDRSERDGMKKKE